MVQAVANPTANTRRGGIPPLMIGAIVLLVAAAIYGGKKAMDLNFTTAIKGNPAAGLMPVFNRYAALYGLPALLLPAIAYRESRFRPDIISGQTKSPVGAVGLMQFMPASAESVGINLLGLGRGLDPLNIDEAVHGAAAYLAHLFRMFGNWSEAIAAYNWGEGNVQRKGMANAPAETRGYVAEVVSHVPGLA